MAEFSQPFLRTFSSQRLPPSHSDLFVAGRNRTASTQQRQRYGVVATTMEQQPTKVVFKASYPANRHEAQILKLANILQEALNVIVCGPRRDGPSGRYWDVERELERFEESLTALSRRTIDSVTLAQFGRGGRNTGEASDKELSRGADGRQGGGRRSDENEFEAPGNQRSRASRLSSLRSENYSGTLDGLLCVADEAVEDQIDEQVEERMANLLPLEDVVLNRSVCRDIFQEGVRYMSDMMLGKWNDFLPQGDQNAQSQPEDAQHAVLEMARWAMLKGYRTADEVLKDKGRVHGVFQSRYSRGYIRGQESVTAGAEILNMEPWFVHGIEVAGQSTDMTMPSCWMRDKESPEKWDNACLSRLLPWGDKGTYVPTAPDQLGFYPDDPTHTSFAASQMRRDGIFEDDYIARAFPLPKVIQLPFLGWSPIPPSTYQSWSVKTLLEDKSTSRRLMYERKDLDISRLKELMALRKRWQEQDIMYLKRYRRYVVSDPEARKRGWIHGSDYSFWPAKRPPVVEKIGMVKRAEKEERPSAVFEPYCGISNTLTEDAEIGSEGSIGEPEHGHREHTGANGSLVPQQPPLVEPRIGRQIRVPNNYSFTPNTSWFCSQPLGTTGPSTPPTINRFGELPGDEDEPISPIVTQIDEFLSDLMASTTPLPDGNENVKLKHKLQLSSLLEVSSQLGRHSAKNVGYDVPVSPLPLIMHAKGEEKPLPSLPSTIDYDPGGSLRSIEGEGYGQGEVENRDYSYLSNSLPQHRSDRESLEAYAQAMEDVYGLRRREPTLGGDYGDGEEGASKKGSKDGVQVTRITGGPLLKAHSVDAAGQIQVPTSAVMHDADGSVYSEDESEREGAGKPKAVEVDTVDSQEPLQRRWMSLRRVGSPTWKEKGVVVAKGKAIKSGIRGFFGIGM